MGSSGADQLADEPPVVIAEAVVRLLRALGAGRGCLIVLEDLQWSDPETLGVVEYLADNLGGEPVRCVVTIRSESSSPALTLAGRLTDRRAVEGVELARLEPGEVATMVRACLTTESVPRDVEWFVASRSDGLPFFVEELLGGLVHAGALRRRDGGWVAVSRLVPAVPLTFRETVRARLSALTAHGRLVVQAAAILGRRFDWSLLPQVTALSAAQVLGALREAREDSYAS